MKGKNRLARSIFRKSAGNPLYIKQIIYNLYEEGHLFFSADELCWRVKRVSWTRSMLTKRLSSTLPAG